MPERSVQAILEESTPKLMQIEGVIGTALGSRDEKPVIVVLVAALTPELKAQLPTSIEGYPTAIQETGEIRALDA